MCRMVGVVFRREFPLRVLHDLRRVSEVGRVPDHERPGHRDGWGIVSFRSGSPWYLGRSVREACNDPSFDSALEDVLRVQPPNIVIAHVRALSKGKPSQENTHPFVSGNLVLAHNGTVHGFRPRTTVAPKGETDSELLLLRLADLVAQEGNIRSAIKSLVREDIRRTAYTAAILLVSDGTTLYGYRDYASGMPADYYDMRLCRADDHIALFQETELGYEGKVSQVRDGELVSVSLDLDVRREMVV